MRKRDPKWDDFEPYKGPEDNLPRWLEVALNLFMPILIYSIIFCVCGFVLWILPYGAGRFFDRAGFALNEVAWLSWARFFTGGVIGVVAVLLLMRKRPVFSPDGESIEEFGERHPVLLVACLPLLFWVIFLIVAHFRASIS